MDSQNNTEFLKNRGQEVAHQDQINPTITNNFELIFNTSPDAILITRVSDGTIIEVNAAFTKLMGYNSVDIEGKTTGEINLWKNPSDRRLIVNEINHKGFCENIEMIFLTSDGRELIGLVSARSFLMNGIPHLISVARDITQRKQSEKALQESEKKYRNIFDNIQDVYYEAALDGTFLEISPSIERFTQGQFIRENLLGTSFLDFYVNIEERKKFFDELFKSGRVDDFELTIRNKKDSIRMISVSSVLSFDNEGKPFKVIGSMRDVTERKAIEKALMQSKQELMKLNATKDRFFSILAHDLRSPFNGFLGFLELMENEFSEFTSEELYQYIKKTGQSARNLFSLLENLLEWSKLQMEMAIAEPTTFYLFPMIESNLELIYETSVQKDVRFENLVNNDISVYADKRMVDSVFRNLISNGLKFSHPGGKVLISARENNGQIEIAVRDTGIGMSKKLSDEIFLVDAHTSRKGTSGEPSSGLGLILCKEFVERNGGTISVESKQGHGSVFLFTLPVQPPPFKS